MKHILTLACLVCGPGSLAAAPADGARPNIVVIYADDLGYGDVQCYNPSRGKIPTPHIDRLASEGMRFTDAHSSSGVCSPSRYTLLTGRYHWRTRLQSGIVGMWGKPLIAADRLTVAGTAETATATAPPASANGISAGIGRLAADDRPFLVPKEKPGRGRHVMNIVPRGSESFHSPSPAVRRHAGSTTTSAPTCPTGRRTASSKTIARSAFPSEFLPARLLRNNQASLQGPALKDWTLEPILPALGDRAVRFIGESCRSQRSRSSSTCR